jgi:hypothetical protein
MAEEDTFAIIKPDAFGQPWIEYTMVKNTEEEPEVEEGDEAVVRPPREEFVRVGNTRAPDMGVEVLKRIVEAGFTIVDRKTMRLTKHVGLPPML